MDQEALEVRITNLETQLANLKTSTSKFHDSIYERLREIETQNAVTAERYSNIMDQLDSLKNQNASILLSIDELSKKPARRYESAITSFISGIVGIIVGIIGKNIFWGN